jgi:hypothetical protein
MQHRGMTDDRTAVLIIRAWVEQHPTSPLRATVRRTTDVSAGFESTEQLADADAVAQVVRMWLRDVQARGHP